MAKDLGIKLALAMLASLPAATASAENVTFAVIGPHEYELPVNFKDFDAFVQYGEANTTNQTYNANGNLEHMANQDLNIGFTKFVRFITFDGLPNVGFAPEAIVPEVNSNSGNGNNQYGIADPIFGGAVWIKPNKDSTFGFQTFIQAPIGTENETNHYYDNISTIFYDYQFKSWDIDGDTGGIFRSQQHLPAMAPTPASLGMAGMPGTPATTINTGTTFFTNLRVGFKVLPPSIPIEPFAALDYEYDTAYKNAATNATTTGHMEDLNLGAGGVITISSKYSLTLRYSRSVYGVNEPPTNAVWVKFVSILP